MLARGLRPKSAGSPPEPPGGSVGVTHAASSRAGGRAAPGLLQPSPAQPVPPRPAPRSCGQLSARAGKEGEGREGGSKAGAARVSRGAAAGRPCRQAQGGRAGMLARCAAVRILRLGQGFGIHSHRGSMILGSGFIFSYKPW